MSITESTDNKEYDPIFNLMKENKTEEALKYVKENKLKSIDCGDANGTTPLQYAAFRGLYDLCKLLIENGANVNAKSHDQGYSALMFAAISNHHEIVNLLLENEADTDCTNAIGRTASQMASFVNSNESADLIKGYLSKKSLEYYTNINSISETEPKLPKGECFEKLYELLTKSINYSPVRIIKAVMNSPILFENVERVIKTLDAFVTKSFKESDTGTPNDILAFKLHYYKYILDYMLAQKKKSEEKKSDDQKTEKIFEICIKRLLAEEKVEFKDKETGQTETDLSRVFEDRFMRESIRKFPYPECALVQQMVTILSKVPIGTFPSALSVITDCVNGQNLNECSSMSKVCATCLSKQGDLKLCSHCKKVSYCDQFCQRMHWPLHKKETPTM